MTNINCLENIACPNCGNEDRFNIVVTAVATVTDDGAEVTGAIDWHDRSFISCPACEHDGTFGEFRVSSNTGLPPDPDAMNSKRASWANTAIRAFQFQTGTDDEDIIGDLLTNLMHWCDRNNHDFGIALDRARLHYEAETASHDISEEAV